MNHHGMYSGYNEHYNQKTEIITTPDDNRHVSGNSGYHSMNNGHALGQGPAAPAATSPYCNKFKIEKSSRSGRHYFVNTVARDSSYAIPEELANNPEEMNRLCSNIDDVGKMLGDEFPVGSYKNFNWEKFGVLLANVQENVDTPEDKALLISLRSTLNLVHKGEHPQFISYANLEPEMKEEEGGK